MSITSNEIETAIQNERITELEQRIDDLWKILSGQNERIKQLEAAARVIGRAWDTVVEHTARIEKLEAALLDVARCLVDGRVDMAMQTADELHRHRILGTESVQAMVEVYHRLKE